MADREKVIKAWEIFRESNPYEICSEREFRAIREPEYCMGQMIADTIELLKEQEQTIQNLQDIIAILEGRRSLMTDRVYIVSRTLENKIAIAENNDQNTLIVTLDVLKEILALLKEREAVKPKSKSRKGEYPHIVHRCGNCNEILYEYYKYCPSCGRAVKWE